MYQRAAGLLSKSQYPETRDRLNKCALIVLRAADTILAPATENKGHREFKPRGLAAPTDKHARRQYRPEAA